MRGRCVGVSFHKPMDRIHQLGDLSLAILPADRFADAAIDMPFHHLERGLIQRAPGRGELLNDINAVPPGFDHTADPPDLSLDPP